MSLLRRLRESRGWDMREAAKRAGCSTATVSRAERRGTMTIETFCGLCRAYGLASLAEDIEQLVGTKEAALLEALRDGH